MNENIIINFPSNIGDAIMALPVVEALCVKFPQARITAMVSPKTEALLSRYSLINNTILFKKDWPIVGKFKFAVSLRQKYDIFVDLKNTLLPVFAGAKKSTPFFRRLPKSMHKKDTHLSLVKNICDINAERTGRFVLSQEEESRWDKLGIKDAVFVSCASMSHIKQYPQVKLKEVMEILKKKNSLVVLGEERDRDYYKEILFMDGVMDLAGKTQMWDIAYLIDRYARVVLAVDSSILHLSSFLNKPIVSFFGPTNPVKFGPWSENCVVLRNNRVKCSPCEKAACRYNIDCMDIRSEEVVAAVNKISGHS